MEWERRSLGELDQYPKRQRHRTANEAEDTIAFTNRVCLQIGQPNELDHFTFLSLVFLSHPHQGAESMPRAVMSSFSTNAWPRAGSECKAWNTARVSVRSLQTRAPLASRAHVFEHEG